MLVPRTLQTPCRPLPRNKTSSIRSTCSYRVTCRSSTAQASAEESRVVSVSVDLGSAIEQINVTLTDPNSKLLQAKMEFPLGLVLENVDDEVVVTEVSKGSAAAAAKVHVGDIVRATSAVTMQMTYPTMNIMFGGVGRPKLVKILLPAAKAPFHKVMDAVRSNSPAQGGDGSIILVLERVQTATGSSSSSSSSSTGSSSSTSGSKDSSTSGSSEERQLVGAGVGAGAGAFDPRIFESIE